MKLRSVSRTKWWVVGWSLLVLTAPVGAEESPTPAVPLTVEQITNQARPSLVTLTVAGREGGQRGLGTGFVIGPRLIATNLHVIGEGFPFQVELSDGTDLPVQAVHASDHGLDLAIIEVAPGSRELKSLPLGDANAVSQGASVIVLGNPLGYKHSVVAGIVSAKREVNGQEMLQLAIPIEPGNSGGPVLDMQGRVVGLVNMKSTAEANLGFAIQVNQLQRLLDNPNRIAIERWTTIGGMDPKRWQPLHGATWKQRAGRIHVSGAGGGFGGRSLCLYQATTPEVPFELGVQVKLDDEAGAAGLVFHADSGDRHYGFYPSNGRLRLSCFEGPDVQSWRVLREFSSSAYRPGEWNHLAVRVEKDKLLCYVNGELVLESTDQSLTAGKVGLAKFRQTVAEFKQFEVGAMVRRERPSTAEWTAAREATARLPSPSRLSPTELDALLPLGEAGLAALRRQAAELDTRAAELRRIAIDLRTAQIAGDLRKLVDNRDTGFDLLRAALTIARLEEEDIDVTGYVDQVERMAVDIRSGIPEGADEAAKIARLNDYLFQQNGFHGNRFDYYHRANSLLNRVIDDRAGLPITLSLLYLELGKRIDLKLEGVGLPSHFVVRWVRSEGEGQLIDVFEKGKFLSREEAARLVRDRSGATLEEEHLAPQTARQILRRLVGNLWRVAQEAGDGEGLLRLAEIRLAIDPDSLENRVERYRLRRLTGRLVAAVADLNWLLDQAPPGIDLDAVQAERTQLQERLEAE